jgi:hypothetical protein
MSMGSGFADLALRMRLVGTGTAVAALGADIVAIDLEVPRRRFGRCVGGLLPGGILIHLVSSLRCIDVG